MLGIIVVNYKTIERTAQYVREELTKIKTPHKVVIVNNACTDEHNLKLAEACNAYWVSGSGKMDTTADVFVLGAEENLGYAKGNNLGVEFLTRHFDVEYLLFSNNDIVFKDDDVVESLIGRLEEIKDAGIIGPSVLLHNDETKRNPYVKPSIWKTHIIPNFFLPVFIFLRQDLSTANFDREASDGYCYRLSGSFMLTKTKLFIKAGMFDPATFLYCEEPILSERYLNIGFKTVYFGKVAVIHEHGYTSKRTCLPLQAQRMDFESQLYYFKKYRSISCIVTGLAILSFYTRRYVWYPIIQAMLRVRNGVRK